MRHARGLLLVLLVSCTNEVTVASNTCGNYVLEPGEDCDQPGAACTKDCRLACTIGMTECPDGMACGADGACHAPTGAVHASTSFGFDVGLVAAADLDGDHIVDLLGVDSGALTFSRGGTPPFATVASQTTPATVSVPAVHDYTGDGRADVLLPARGGLFAYTTETGAPAPVAFPFSEETSGALIHMRAAPSLVAGTLLQLDLTGDGAGNATGTKLSVDGVGTSPCGLLFGPDSLRGHAIHPYKDGNSRQLVPLSLVGADLNGNVYSGLCVDGPGGIADTKRVPIGNLSATASLSATGETFFASLSGGLCPELVVPITDTAGSEALVVNGAQNASGCNVGPATMLTTTVITGAGSPLALIHLAVSSGAKVPALVMSTGIYTVDTVAHTATLVVPSTRSWQYAVAADVNGDGIEDLITTGTSADVEVLTQLGSLSTIPQFHQTVIPTTDAIQLIAAGDFDGDGLLDIAMAAIDSTSSHAGQIELAFADPPTGYSAPVTLAQIDELDYLVARDVVDPTLPPGFDQQDDLIVAHGGDDLMTESAQLTYFYGAGNRQLYAPFTTPLLKTAKGVFAIGGRFAEGGAYGVVAGYEPESTGVPDMAPFVVTMPTTDAVNLTRPTALKSADSCTPTTGVDPFCMDVGHYSVWPRSMATSNDVLLALRGDNVLPGATGTPTCGAYFPDPNGNLGRVACADMFPHPPPFTSYGGSVGSVVTSFTGISFGGARILDSTDTSADAAVTASYALTTVTPGMGTNGKPKVVTISYQVTLLATVTLGAKGPIYDKLVELGGACPATAGSCTPSEVSAFAQKPMFCSDAALAELGTRTVDGKTYGAAGKEVVTVCAPHGTLGDPFPDVTVYARFVAEDASVHYETVIPPSGISRANLEVGDVNGDGLDDLMLTSGFTGNGLVYTFLQCDSHDTSCAQEVAP